MQEAHDWWRQRIDQMSEEKLDMYHYGYWTALDVFWDMQHSTLEEVGLAYCYHGSERVYYEVEK